MEYVTIPVVHETMRELLADPGAQAELLGQLLKHRREREFTAVAGQWLVTVTSSSSIADTRTR